MRKIFYVLLVIILACTLIFSGCGSSSSSSKISSTTTPPSQKDSTTANKKLKLGFNNFLKGFYSLDILEKSFKATADALNVDTMITNDEGKVEQSVQNVQNMISSGVDGIVFFGISDTLFPVVSQKCREAKIPFVIYDHIPSDKSMEILQQNPYFVGVVGEHDYDAGYPIGEYAANQGLKKAIVVTGKNTDTTHSARVKGFTDSFTKAGGRVLDVGWGNTTLADALSQTDDLLTAHPDVDCIYATGGDFGSGALQALQKHPNVKAKVFVTDLDPDILTGLKAGTITAANGAHWVNVDFATILLVNYLNNHPLRDSGNKAPVVTVPVLTLPNNQVSLYQKFWLDNVPFSVTELRNLTAPWNPNVTLNEVKSVISNYSIKSRLEEKQKEGLVTSDELKKAGIIN
ncbi:sugar ABC transporter substrate-binding protein [Thermoanaerobacterium thermosaccharolyticum]|uniref:Monosaccharide ABC transporter substrate-binding protein, CUT2 family n=1 Tax=Thermoanaerobacterium thermosaccharolyticum M0795 TaxID=698948 RepID=L0IKQ8_THETR|nr:sugar ABC transporter substrate-binding protein [Thermoanaerobacterium thermosaccharolyticum]AGB18572.1 monosaccharide ABC transporter substrate-binding protein, CUT2 family [Thermoanaerobacterium thermosaccharolyticum M0795]